MVKSPTESWLERDPPQPQPPLRVKFNLRRPALRLPRTLVITDVSVEMVRDLQAKAASDAIDEVILVGYRVAVGWRAFVKREVRFIEQPTTSAEHATAQRQASMRIQQLETKQ